MIVLDLSILNQKGTPMFNSDTFANRPNFGIVGRIFISTDTSEIYRDTGTSWVLIADTSSGGTITGSGTTGTIPIWSGSTSLGNSSLVEAALQITSSKDLLVNGNAFVIETSTAANNAASLAAYGQNTLGYAAAFSSNNIGAIYGAVAGINLQTFAGSATFAQANLASAGVFVNSIDFSSPGSTITMTQSTGIRAMTGNQAQLQYQGTNSGTINHAAVQQNLGFYRPPGATGVLTITNAYSHLINALDDYGAGFTFTNRFGIYQAGASDINYFASRVLIGSLSDNGLSLQITGNVFASGNLGLGIIPVYKLDVLGDAHFGDGNNFNPLIQNAGSGRLATSPGYSFLGDLDTGMYNPNSANTLAFSTAGVESMRISNAQNLLLGTTIDSGYKLQVQGTTRSAFALLFGTYTNGDTTPSVASIGALTITNSNPTTISNFTSGVTGQILYLYFTDSNTTINRSNAYLSLGLNFVSSADDTLTLFYTGTSWVELSRSINS